VTYGDWNPFGVLVLVLLMLVGGGTCSTAGAIKQYRVYLLAKAVAWEVRRALLPRSAVVSESIWHGDELHYIDDRSIRRAGAFVFLYLATLAAGAAVIAAHGESIADSVFEFASAQGTVGLTVGVTHADAPKVVLWAMIVGMFLGRLEFFVVIVGVVKIARDLPALLRRVPVRALRAIAAAKPLPTLPELNAPPAKGSAATSAVPSSAAPAQAAPAQAAPASRIETNERATTTRNPP
jgi:trk system potassium uptake protein TrkH